MTSRYQKNCKYRDRVADVRNRDLYGETTSNMFALQADSGVHNIYESKEVNKGLSPGRRIKEEWGSVVYWWFGIEQDQPLIM